MLDVNGLDGPAAVLVETNYFAPTTERARQWVREYAEVTERIQLISEISLATLVLALGNFLAADYSGVALAVLIVTTAALYGAVLHSKVQDLYRKFQTIQADFVPIAREHLFLNA